MITAAKIKTIHMDLDKVLKDFAQKHGLTVAPSRIRYSESTFKTTLEFGDSEATDGADPKLLNNMIRHGWKFGLYKDDIGQTFHHHETGKTTIDGMSGTTKVAITGENGKHYVIRASVVAKLLGRKASVKF